MKKFLSKEKVLATAIAALTSGSVNANLPESVKLESQLSNLGQTVVRPSNARSNSGFILTPSVNAYGAPTNLHTAHASHASHASHGSHQSHASHYSSGS